jgi:hypothetical protein
MSLSIDDIDVFSEGHIARDSEEVSFVLNLDLKFFSGRVDFDVHPVTEFSGLR